MRTIVVYRPNTEVERPVVEFMREFEHRTGKSLEVIDPDSREGATFIETYGIMEYPTMIALDDSGTMQQLWAGLPLPTMSELSYYAS